MGAESDSNLRDAQAALLHRLNELNSITRNLPPEVLSEIFADVCADFCFFRATKIHHPHIQLISQVCSSWRQTVLTTPSLWCSLEIRLPDAKWATRNSLNLLRLHIKNAGVLSLSIGLETQRKIRHRGVPLLPQEHYECRAKYVPYTDLLHAILAEYHTRLGCLILGQSSTVPVEWLETLQAHTVSTPSADGGQSRTYPNLTSLVIGYLSWQGLASPTNLPYQLFKDPETTPLLRRLRLRSCGGVEVPLNNLTALHLRYCPPKECINILVQCFQLTEFCVQQSHLASESAVSVPALLRSVRGRTVVLDNLQTLVWDFSHEGWDRILITSFRYPSLSALFCCQSGHSIKPKDAPSMPYSTQYIHFLSSLQRLRYYGRDTTYMDLAASVDFWKSLGHVGILDELHLYDFRSRNDTFWPDVQTGFIRCFTLASTWSRTRPSRSPRVKALHLYKGYARLPADKVNSFLAMLESRWNVPQGEVRLDSVTLYVPPFQYPVNVRGIWEEWTKEQRTRLQILVENGFRIRMREGVFLNDE